MLNLFLNIYEDKDCLIVFVKIFFVIVGTH